MAATVLSIVAIVVSVGTFAWTERRRFADAQNRRNAGPLDELWPAISKAQRTFDDIAAKGGEFTDYFLDPERQYLGEEFRTLSSRVDDQSLAGSLRDVATQWDAAFANAPAPRGARVYFGDRNPHYEAEDAAIAKKLGSQSAIIEDGKQAVARCTVLAARLEKKVR